MSDFWYLMRDGKTDPARNMATDEALLEFASEIGAPVLRLYGWSVPAATFGYFQKYFEIEKLTPLRPLIRRPTGGGLVPHDRDWTYSLVFPPDHFWCSLKATESYERIHRWIQAAFEAVGVAASLAETKSKSARGQCFVGFEKSDVTVQGIKIAGAAQRRNKRGLLIQGSIQPPDGINREDWENAFASISSFRGCENWRTIKPAESFQKRVSELEEIRFSRMEYNCRR